MEIIKRVLLAICAGILLIPACGGPEETPEPAVDIDAAPETILVSVTDTLGLMMGDSTRVFGTITQASWGDDGNLYALDGQLGRLSVFSPELELIRQVGGLGSGPGEFQYPQSFAFLGDGSLAVCDWGGRSIVFFDSNLQYSHQHTGYYPSSPRFIVPGPGESYVAMSMYIDEDVAELSGESYVARFGQEKEPEEIYDSWPLMISYYGDDPDGPDASIGRVDHDFDSNLEGTVYLAEKDDSTYLVEYFLPDSSGVLVEKEWERVAKTEEEMNREIYEETMTEDGPAQVGRRTIRDVYPWHLAIGSVDMDPEGNIWVGQGYTSMPTFEVYSPEGELLYVAIIPELEGVQGLEYSMRHGCLAYDRQPLDYPKVYLFSASTSSSM